MRRITPDTAIALIVVIGAIVLAVFLAAPSLSDGWRPFLGIALPVVVAAFPALWISNVRVRIAAYRLWYKVAGPSVEVQIVGTVPLTPESQIDDELSRVKDVARSWRNNARVDAELDNRIIIAAGARTLTVTLMHSGSNEEGCDSDEVGDSLDLYFELRGYQAKVTTVDDLLISEVAPLLQELANRSLANRRTPALSMNLDMGKRNPFLGFYLRDVATERIQVFQIRLDERVSSHKVRVEVTMNRLSLQASDPLALVNAARRYLASPALANLD